jgi:hypothetical protein
MAYSSKIVTKSLHLNLYYTKINCIIPFFTCKLKYLDEWFSNRWVDRHGSSLGGDTINKTFVSEWLSKVDAWDGNLFIMSSSNFGGVFKYFTKFQIKVAESHAIHHVDLTDLYQKKIANMKKFLCDINNNRS